MGFKKSAVPKEIEIPMKVVVTNETTGEREDAHVAHYFRLPTAAERQKHQSTLVKFKVGRRQEYDVCTHEAHFYLWTKCCVRVAGYDDLPGNDWKSYFNPPAADAPREVGDDVPYQHAIAAVDRLLNEIKENEGSAEKN